MAENKTKLRLSVAEATAAVLIFLPQNRPFPKGENPKYAPLVIT